MTYDPAANLVKNLDKYCEFASWWTFYPDLALDLMASDTGGLKLNTDQRIFMRGGARFFTEHGCFPRGWGKCVDGETYVFTDKGLKQIGELFNFQQDNIETEYLQFLKIVNWKGEVEPAPFGIYSGRKPIRIINTAEGYTLTGNTIHPILILDKDGRLKFREMDDLRVGDYVAISVQNELFGNKLELDYMDDFQSWLENIPLTTKIDLKPLPETLTPDLGYLFGVLMSDHCLSLQYKTQIEVDNLDIREYAKEYLKDVFQYDVIVSKNGYGIGDICIRKFLELCGVKNYRLDDRRVPFVIASAPKKIQKAFLMGFFDCMAEFTNGKLTLVLKCKEFMEQLQMMLLNFGIISVVRTRTKKGRSISTMRISGYNITLFEKNIGFKFFKDIDKVQTYISLPRVIDKRVIPYQKRQISQFYFEMQDKHPELYMKVVRIMDESADGFVRYESLADLINVDDANESEVYDHFKELLECNYYFTKITTIDRGMSHVYDLSVPDSHSFVTNGFVSHNTWTEVADMFLMAIRYPNITLSLSAQTLENSAKLLKDKYNEITKQYPLFFNEITKTSFSKSYASIEFNNRSTIDVIANSQSSKGLRRNRLNIEESNLMDNVTFDDALAPVVEVGRMTAGKLSIINPEELNQQINFYTTPGFKASSEHERSINVYHDMVDLKGSILLGSDWMLGCWYGRGSSKANIIKKKSNMSPIAFQMNYGGTWVGSSDGALVNINRLLNCRTLTEPELESSNPSDEFYMGVDVARSQKKTNNQSSIAIGKVIRDNSGKIKEIQLSNLIHMSNTLNFATQACIVKRIRKRYNARKVVVDGNGLSIVPLYGNIYRKLFKLLGSPMFRIISSQ